MAATSTWDTVPPALLGRRADKVDSLISYVGQTNAKAFIVLKDGKIVVEQHYGSFPKDSVWYRGMAS